MRGKLTKDLIRHAFNRLMANTRRLFEGGLQFGLDWPTLRVTYPARYKAFKRLDALYRSLPE